MSIDNNQNNSNEECVFFPAVGESINENGVREFTPCVYHNEIGKVIWIANYSNIYMEKALEVATSITKLLEEDYNLFKLTGKKNDRISNLLKRNW